MQLPEEYIEAELPSHWWRSWAGGYAGTTTNGHRYIELLTQHGCVLLASTTQLLPPVAYLAQQEAFVDWMRSHQLKWLAVGNGIRSGTLPVSRSLAWLILLPDSTLHGLDHLYPPLPSFASTVSLSAGNKVGRMHKLAAAFLDQHANPATPSRQPLGGCPLYAITLERATTSTALSAPSLIDVVSRYTACLPHYEYQNGKLSRPVWPQGDLATLKKTLYFSRPIRGFSDGVQRSCYGEIIPGNHGGLVGLPVMPRRSSALPSAMTSA
jgi:hypothetical protein